MTRHVQLTVALALILSAAFVAGGADTKVIDALNAAGIKTGAMAGGGTQVDIPAEKLNEDAWKLIESLGDLKYVHCKGNQFDNPQLTRLCKVASIESIVFYNPGVDDKGLPALANLPNLRSLAVDHGLLITGTGLADLAGKKLEAINFGGSKIDDAGMDAIGKLTQLHEMSIRHCRITSAGFANFEKLSSLQKLVIYAGYHPVTRAADLAHLSGLKQLKDVTIAEMILPYENGLAHLAPLKQLKKLTLKTCDISEADLAKLKGDLPDAKIDFTPAPPESVKKYHEELEKKAKAQAPK